MLCPVCENDTISKVNSSLSKFKATTIQLRGGLKVCRCYRHLNKQEQEVEIVQALTEENSNFLRWETPSRSGNSMFSYKCYCGAYVTMTSGNFRQGKRCMACRDKNASANMSLTLQEWQEALEAGGCHKEGTKIISRVGRMLKIKCPICSSDPIANAGLCSGVFKVASHTVKSTRGCRCNPSHYLTYEQKVFNIKDKIRNTNKSFVSLSDKDKKVTLRCPKGSTHTLLPWNILSNGFNCKCCKEGGSGFSQTIPAYMYLYKCSIGGRTGCKVGITNREVSCRVKEQGRSRGSHEVKDLLVFRFNLGCHAKVVEDAIFSRYAGGFFSKAEFPDGYRETLDADEYNEIVALITRCRDD